MLLEDKYMNKLKTLRKTNNYSTQHMADMLKISKTFYWQIENNKRRLSYDMAIRIASIFNLKPDNLFFDDFINKDK